MIILKIYYIFLLLFFSKSVFAIKPAPWVGVDFKGVPCKGGSNVYGPYDYTLPAHKGKYAIVERHHFSKNVEFLIKGDTSMDLTQDINYTLVTLPNHHKALLSVLRYQIRLNKKIAKLPLRVPVECYFQRAINFSPKDAATYSLYAYYLRKINLLDKAREKYIKAIDIAPDSQKIKYSYALLLIDMKKYEQALEIAKSLYVNKNLPNGLKQQLIKLGVWE